MKYVRLTSFWLIAFFCVVLASSVLSPLGLFADTRVNDSMIYPMFRFFRGGEFQVVTENTLERVFTDQFRAAHLVLPTHFEKRLARHLYQLCLENRVDPAFVLSVIQVESSFRLDVTSHAGAVGLMQIMPDTGRVVARRNHIAAKITAKSLADPFLNLTLGVIYLRELRELYSGLSPYYHLAAYNMGPHRLDELRAQPGFKPEKSLKYYQDIMKGVNAWRFYGPKKELKEAAIQARGARVKSHSTSA